MLPPSPFTLASLALNNGTGPSVNVFQANMSVGNISEPSIGYTGANTSFAVNYSLEFQLSGLMNTMAYGAVAILLVNMIHTLLVRWSNSMCARLPYETIVFVLALFVLNTIYSVTTIVYMESTFIYNVAYPLGIPIFTSTLLPTTVGILNQISFALGTVLVDAFLLGRARVIFQAARNRRAYLFLAPAAILFLCSIVLAVIQTLDVILPDGVFNNAPINWSSNYSIASLAVNLYLTFGIAIQIGVYKRRSASLQTRRDHTGSRLYTHLFTIFIESAALYSVIALGVVITYDSPSNMVWSSIWLPTQTIASFLITYRIARDGAWEKETSSAGPAYTDDSEVGVLDIRASPLTLKSERDATDYGHGGVHVFTSTLTYSEEK